MTKKSTEGKSPAKAPSASNPKELMQQLLEMMEEKTEESTDHRLEKIEKQLNALIKKVEAGGGGGPVNASNVSGIFKKLINSVLIESGFLEKIVASTLSHQFDEDSEFAAVIHNSVQKEIKTWLSSNEMKELMDDKFRHVTVYLKTDVIPTAVRQALENADVQHA